MEQPWAAQFSAGTPPPALHRVHHSFTWAFLFRDPTADADIITDLDRVHPVGVFTQLTSEAKKLHTVELPVIPTLPITPTHETEEGEKKVKEHKTFALTSFLPKPPISVVNMKNLTTLLHKKVDKYIRAFMLYLYSRILLSSTTSSGTKLPNLVLPRSPQNVFDEPDKLADYAAVSTGGVQELQEILESFSVSDWPARVIPNVAVEEYQEDAGDGVRFGKMVFDEELSRLQMQELICTGQNLPERFAAPGDGETWRGKEAKPGEVGE
ncbi:hypothetical protein BDQ17DRAFT_1336979 [Cyathus striatus]|nr:hypothetical protein BDQ17DRAFT_1336979 [Cyathus striatus]